MIFYKRISICNLFAYYGTQSVEFSQKADKHIYLLFGKNGFGKTSFIRSIKLLFAGSGLLDTQGVVPDVALSIASGKERGVFTPKTLLLGQNSDNGWKGVLNHYAVKNDENKFFVELELSFNGHEICIKREWTRYPNLSEKLTFSKDGQILYDNQAREEIEQILPLNFLQFFVFDGEEIEAMADDISTELKDKIQSMLNISILDKLISQINQVEKDLLKQSNLASQTKARLIQLNGELEAAVEILENSKQNIKIYENEVIETDEILTTLRAGRDAKIKSNSKESESLQNAKNNALSQLEIAKTQIIDFGGEILFLGLDGMFEQILAQLERNIDVGGFNKDDLTKLAKFSVEFLSQKIKFDCDKIDLNVALRDAFLEFIKTSDDKFKGLNKATLNAIYSAACENSKRLLKAIYSAKDARNKIAQTSKSLEDFISNTALKNELQSLDDNIAQAEDKRHQASENLRQILQQKSDLETKISELENERDELKDRVGRDVRIKNKLEILSDMKKQIAHYKHGRIERTSVRLKDEILKNYKTLLENDNVANVQIENFIVKLINANDEVIAVKNQSAGQKQIAAISIFWALSKLSDRKLPLIIDTPLARLDAQNRKNIIQNYYANASAQVIVLPTDTEFGQRELTFASGKIAGIYEITNDEKERDHASIIKKDEQC